MIVKHKPLFKFMVIAFSCYATWFIIYESWLMPEGKVDFWLTDLITKNAICILKVVGYNVSHQIEWTKHYISGPLGKILGIANACNGLVLYPIFIGFIIASPGKIKNKLVMILVGSIGIYTMNLLRVIVLCIIQIEGPEYLDFNHKYTFVVLVYGFIFFLWMIWINKYSGIELNKSTNNNVNQV